MQFGAVANIYIKKKKILSQKYNKYKNVIILSPLEGYVHCDETLVTCSHHMISTFPWGWIGQEMGGALFDTVQESEPEAVSLLMSGRLI